jgi:tRNA-splicing ligase RtcB
MSTQCTNSSEFNNEVTQMIEPYVVGTHDTDTLQQINTVAEKALRTALMADGHLGYGMPIGGVGAFDNQVSPSFVGYDIACGNLAVRTNTTGQQFLTAGGIQNATMICRNTVADDIIHNISIGIGGINEHLTKPDDHAVFQDPRWEVIPKAIRDKLKERARAQLGTVGAGNHFIDVFVDEEDRVWFGVHFGSRNLGRQICSGFLALINNQEWTDLNPKVSEKEVGLGLVSLTTQLGQDYWAAMELAGDYAYAGREWVMITLLNHFGLKLEDRVHNHHNYAWTEWVYNLEGEQSSSSCVVIRKGATPARPNQRGFVGGSMGDISVILEGRTFPPAKDYYGNIDQQSPWIETYQAQRNMMFSTVHGAGRLIGRSQAKGKPNKDGGWKREPLVTAEMMTQAVKDAGIVLRGGDRDESPHVYRKLADVLQAQGDTIKVLHTLTPKIVCMAPPNTRR